MPGAVGESDDGSSRSREEGRSTGHEAGTGAGGQLGPLGADEEGCGGEDEHSTDIGADLPGQSAAPRAARICAAHDGERTVTICRVDDACGHELVDGRHRVV